jgi:two-component system, OmpR family, KDP operon response regulator KdpE
MTPSSSVASLAEDETRNPTTIEYRLLTLPIGYSGKVLTHRRLQREVWRPGFVDSSRCVRICVAHLGQKLEGDPARPRPIVTESGGGYRFQR